MKTEDKRHCIVFIVIALQAFAENLRIQHIIKVEYIRKTYSHNNLDNKINVFGQEECPMALYLLEIPAKG